MSLFGLGKKKEAKNSHAAVAVIVHLKICRNIHSMAVLIWIMIYPMMIKVDFKSIKNIEKIQRGYL